MADIEQRVDKLDERVTNVEKRVISLETKFEAFMEEMREFKTEMRDRDNQRNEDIREIRAGLTGMGNHVRNLVWTAMAAIGAMVVTIVYSVLNK